MKYLAPGVVAALIGALQLGAFQANPEPRAVPLAPRTFALSFGGADGSSSFLGVGVMDINAARSKELKLPEERGVEITRVEDGSPAFKAGLKINDVVLEYNGERIEGTEQFVRLVHETPPGRRVRFLISRAGVTQKLAAVIGARKIRVIRIEPGLAPMTIPKFEMPEVPLPEIPGFFDGWRGGMLGIEAESLTPQLTDYFGVKAGALVRSVRKDSVASRAGIKAGDVIVKVDETKVRSPEEISMAIRASRSKKTIPLTVTRDRKELTLWVTLNDEPGSGTAPAQPVRPR